MQITKPMLAGKVDSIDDLTYPVIASPKIDGIRCLKVEGQIVSRSFKPIPNDYIRQLLTELLPEGADGEIFVSDFQDTTSAAMSVDGEPGFLFCMFDIASALPYEDRVKDMKAWELECGTAQKKFIKVIPSRRIESPAELRIYEEVMLDAGYEGIMVRSLNGPYKCGRSTTREGYLLKIKRFTDAEAIVIGFAPLMRNDNKAELDNFGNTKRSSTKANKVAQDTLGKFLVRDSDGCEFAVGTGKGLTKKLRKEIWDNRASYLGRQIKFKYQAHGTVDKPRSPIWLGFRDAEDM